MKRGSYVCESCGRIEENYRVQEGDLPDAIRLPCTHEGIEEKPCLMKRFYGQASATAAGNEKKRLLKRKHKYA